MRAYPVVSRTGRRRERGMALAIALIVLVVVSILGIVAMRTALFQNRVSINSQLGTLAFQAAESGIGSTAKVPSRDVLFEQVALAASQPRRLCIGADGSVAVDTTYGTRNAATGVLGYSASCNALPNNPARVTTVVGVSPNPSEMIEGSDPSSASAAMVQVRAEGDVSGTRVRAVNIEDWSRQSPGGGSFTGFM